MSGSEEMAFYGAFSRSHRAGNLLNAHAVKGLELKSQTLFFGQRLQGLANIPRQLFLVYRFQRALMGFRIRPFFRGKSFFCGIVLPWQKDLPPSFSASPPIQTDIHQNAIKPCVEGGIAAKGLQFLKSSKKRLLGQILSVLHIPIGEVIGDRIGLLLITMNEFFDGPWIVRPSLDYKIFIFHP